MAFESAETLAELNRWLEEAAPKACQRIVEIIEDPDAPLSVALRASQFVVELKYGRHMDSGLKTSVDVNLRVQEVALDRLSVRELERLRAIVSDGDTRVAAFDGPPTPLA